MFNSWKVEKLKSDKNESKIKIKNTAKHAHLVEDGHLQKDKNGKIFGFVEGKHMLKNAMKEVEDNLEKYFEKDFM